jgi:hypothetical protein
VWLLSFAICLIAIQVLEAEVEEVLVRPYTNHSLFLHLFVGTSFSLSSHSTLLWRHLGSPCSAGERTKGFSAAGRLPYGSVRGSERPVLQVRTGHLHSVPSPPQDLNPPRRKPRKEVPRITSSRSMRPLALVFLSPSLSSTSTVPPGRSGCRP